MHELFKDLDPAERKNLIPSSPPDWMEPMLATLTERRFSLPGWLFERKFDGERCLVFRKEGRVRLMSRNRQHLNETYPELEAALQSLKTANFVADGEIVAFEGGTTSFSRLQSRMQVTDREKARRLAVPVFLYLFELMSLDGYDITRVGLRSRKEILGRLFPYTDPLRYSCHREEIGEECYREACAKGWEGIIAKRAGGRYMHRRSPDWLKFKCILQQEFVIGGFTEPAGSRAGFGALLIGYYNGDRLVFSGKVGTGFDGRLLAVLSRRLSSIERKTSPFSDRSVRGKGEHWVEPELVCEVAFSEWTVTGMLRHPRFISLRDDKAVRMVVREKGDLPS
jgi:bifunctional non-homologous end joining protein LigD